jgi:hypothetical protein
MGNRQSPERWLKGKGVTYFIELSIQILLSDTKQNHSSMLQTSIIIMIARYADKFMFVYFLQPHQNVNLVKSFKEFCKRIEQT